MTALDLAAAGRAKLVTEGFQLRHGGHHRAAPADGSRLNSSWASASQATLSIIRRL
jgi:hypothetical protein